ncbi:MAG: tRNA-dihydrouridine synthase family protein [Lachnospiraceae bacterium]|nr:tRNA-dihydrouridine synthase family protein [Lachnospiraceae bacterium]
MKDIKYYLAPMEGITGYIYRNAVHDHFGENIAKYFTPFLVVHEKRAMSNKEIREILPENNKGINLIPQILTDDAEGFGRVERALHEYGYTEVNLNLGCPSKTVATKGRGSGFLKRTEKLDDFLYRIFENRKCDISIKTRIGESDVSEYEGLLEIFNKYPVKELIVHPRVRYEYYKGQPHRDIFCKYAVKSAATLCYNGDVFSKSDVDEIIDHSADKVSAIMTGRGMIADPSLIRVLNGGRPYTNDELKEFLKRITEDYTAAFKADRPVLQKMKELWSYMGQGFPKRPAAVKELLKCRTLQEYKMLEMQILG